MGLAKNKDSAQAEHIYRPRGSRAIRYPKLLTALLATPSLLAHLAEQYLWEDVFCVCSPFVCRAKAQAMGRFVAWFARRHRHPDAPWRRQDTLDYLKRFARGDYRPDTVNREIAQLHNFARWLYDRRPSPMQLDGLPTAHIQRLPTLASSHKKLTAADIRRLTKAASLLTRRPARATQRPWRNRAILAVLVHTGLSVPQIVALRLAQFTEDALLRVKCRSRNSIDSVPIPPQCRDAIADYLERERLEDSATCVGAYPTPEQAPLFLAAGHAMYREHVNVVLTTIQDAANKYTPGEPLQVTPKMLYRDQDAVVT